MIDQIILIGGLYYPNIEKKCQNLGVGAKHSENSLGEKLIISRPNGSPVQESGVRSQESGVRSQESGVRIFYLQNAVRESSNISQ
ncbi:hypothetical protein [Sphaerospermopsis torques-reginae]|uniref:Uncharacterized protein n=1 Tax=Sphaerospermopsis torques-reginae ITEP-024 TaxID=984208 RepID=A0ABX8X633_9CYAN|nr:hypothetical protein [Sphaerospermopsis torques-reginae]QYX33976.1 hypothetical protein K2F26_12120 [Sphaerospermopsis torques-reginae ITEP-024]